MTTPFDIKTIRHPSGFEPGVCSIAWAGREPTGLFVPRCDDGRVYINVGVRDPDSGLVFRVKCLVDTGAVITAIPRSLLGPNEGRHAFQKYEHSLDIWFRDEGKPLRGQQHVAGLFIASPGEGLYLGSIPVVIVSDHGTSDHGILGVDALKLVISVFDSQMFSVWRATESGCSVDREC